MDEPNRKPLTSAENRERRLSLHAAQMRTLEMIIDGASLTEPHWRYEKHRKHLAIALQRSHEALTKALSDIRISEDELRRTTDAIAQTILVLNPDGTTIYANRVALEYSGQIGRAHV